MLNVNFFFELLKYFNSDMSVFNFPVWSKQNIR